MIDPEYEVPTDTVSIFKAVFQIFLILFPSVIHFYATLQVDNIPPLVSRSGKPIDLFASGPISSIGYNAPTLAAIVHRGIRLKKVTTRRTPTSPSVAASTLAQAFKVTAKPFHLYRSYFYIGYISTDKFSFL